MKIKLILINTPIFLCVLLSALLAQAQSVTGNQAAVEWKRYELGNGIFSVLLPEKPVEEVKEVPSSALPVKIYTYGVNTKEGAYIAQYTILGEAAENWAESSLEAYYNGVWAGISGAFNDAMERRNLPTRASLIEKRKVKFSGYDGRELIFTLGTLKGRVLTTVVGRYAFSCMTVWTEAMPETDRERFFNSFIIKVPKANREAK